MKRYYIYESKETWVNFVVKNIKRTVIRIRIACIRNILKRIYKNNNISMDSLYTNKYSKYEYLFIDAIFICLK
jgi:hypothetical protein